LGSFLTFGIETFPVGVEINCGWGDTTAVVVGFAGYGGEEAGLPGLARLPITLFSMTGFSPVAQI